MTPNKIQLSIWKRFTIRFPEAAAEINLSAREDATARKVFMSVRRSKAEVDAWSSSGASGVRSRIVGDHTAEGVTVIAGLPEDTWGYYAAPWTRRARERSARTGK
jgi:hypothetical protein